MLFQKFKNAHQIYQLNLLKNLVSNIIKLIFLVSQCQMTYLLTNCKSYCNRTSMNAVESRLAKIFSDNKNIHISEMNDLKIKSETILCYIANKLHTQCTIRSKYIIAKQPNMNQIVKINNIKGSIIILSSLFTHQIDNKSK